MREAVDAILESLSPGMVLWSGLHDAIIGVADRCGDEPVVVYDRDRVIGILMDRDGMDEEEAAEYVDFNIAGAYVGPGTPILLTPVSVPVEPDPRDALELQRSDAYFFDRNRDGSIDILMLWHDITPEAAGAIMSHVHVLRRNHHVETALSTTGFGRFQFELRAGRVTPGGDVHIILAADLAPLDILNSNDWR